MMYMKKNAVIIWMESATVGQFVENDENNRTVHIEGMCGGRYLLMENTEVCGLTFDVIAAYRFLVGEDRIW